MPSYDNKLTIYHSNQQGLLHSNAKNSESFKTSLDINMTSDTAIAVHNWAENLISTLSDDDYEHSVIETSASLNEILSEN